MALREKILLPVLTTIAFGMFLGFVYSYLASTRSMEESINRSLVREVRLTAGLMANGWKHGSKTCPPGALSQC